MSDPDYDEIEEKMNSGNDDDSESDDQSNGKLTLKARKVRRSNGKWKLYYDKRVFRKEWEEMFPWCEEDPDDPKFAICRACNKKIKAHKGILETHQRTKKHLRNLSGSDDLEENGRNVKNEGRTNYQTLEQLGDDQIGFFTESPVDAAHQAITSLIDKLVEKYHEKRLENLKEQNEAMLELHKERAALLQSENQQKLERRIQQEAYVKEQQDTLLKLMQIEHETKLNALEDEREAKLRAVEQELVFARQEYEKKMRLLDVQLSCMK